MAPQTPFLTLLLLEIAVFILVAGLGGFWLALGLILALSLAGVFVLRSLGMTVLRRAQLQLEQGQITPAEIVTGLWLAAAGLLMLVPGFITSLLGLALFIPLLRRGLGIWVVNRYRAHLVRPAFNQQSLQATEPIPGASHHATPSMLEPGPVIDVEFEDIPAAPSSNIQGQRYPG